MITLARTGKMVRFSEINIGSPFFAYHRVWIRTAADAATALHDTPVRHEGKIVIADTCNFTHDDCGDVEAVEVRQA